MLRSLVLAAVCILVVPAAAAYEFDVTQPIDQLSTYSSPGDEFDSDDRVGVDLEVECDDINSPFPHLEDPLHFDIQLSHDEAIASSSRGSTLTVDPADCSVTGGTVLRASTAIPLAATVNAQAFHPYPIQVTVVPSDSESNPDFGAAEPQWIEATVRHMGLVFPEVIGREVRDGKVVFQVAVQVWSNADAKVWVHHAEGPGDVQTPPPLMFEHAGHAALTPQVVEVSVPSQSIAINDDNEWLLRVEGESVHSDARFGMGFILPNDLPLHVTDIEAEQAMSWSSGDHVEASAPGLALLLAGAAVLAGRRR